MRTRFLLAALPAAHFWKPRAVGVRQLLLVCRRPSKRARASTGQSADRQGAPTRPATWRGGAKRKACGPIVRQRIAEAVKFAAPWDDVR